MGETDGARCVKKIPLSISEDLIGFVGRPMNQAAPHPGRRQALQQDVQSGRFLSKGGLGAGAESKGKERVVCKPGPLLCGEGIGRELYHPNHLCQVDKEISEQAFLRSSF